ncbi:MAG TPA: type II toxin-antitoxin system HigB family toxin [Tepidisphaeraceae bacterium]|nr:type II toxin-antitoxin system HigB family toxin [Tepidisphaeraceae bacterium]
MRIANAEVLARSARRHPDAASALGAWLRVVQEADWHSIAEVRTTYPSADGVAVASGGTVTVFNIRGNNYRLLTRILYRAELVAIIEFLTHAEYDKNQWRRKL